MGWFENVDHFVDYDVFKAFSRLFCEESVFRRIVLVSELQLPHRGFHALDVESQGNVHSDYRFPFGNQIGSGSLNLDAVPFLDELLAFGFIGAWPHLQDKSVMVSPQSRAGAFVSTTASKCLFSQT